MRNCDGKYYSHIFLAHLLYITNKGLFHQDFLIILKHNHSTKWLFEPPFACANRCLIWVSDICRRSTELPWILDYKHIIIIIIIEKLYFSTTHWCVARYIGVHCHIHCSSLSWCSYVVALDDDFEWYHSIMNYKVD